MHKLLRTGLLILCLAPLCAMAQPRQPQLAMLPDSQLNGKTAEIKTEDQLHLSGKITRRQLLAALKKLDVNETAYNEAGRRQLYQLAGLFTHMRLYPLAMKCFLKTLTPDSLVNGSLPFTGNDEQLIAAQWQQAGQAKENINSKSINASHIAEAFNDGKPALAYAMIFHVRQPVRGTAKVHKLAYTGHTYITLIKFNTDSSYASMTFGFGPKKDDLLAATPLEPSSSSTLRDDYGYPWDEVVGKFISRRRFEKILQLARQYDGLAYHLNKNNCTDFGLNAARLAGLEIKDTRGSWPLGAGNNPGTTGESILLGKFSNADTGTHERLFIDTARVNPLMEKLNGK